MLEKTYEVIAKSQGRYFNLNKRTTKAILNISFSIFTKGGTVLLSFYFLKLSIELVSALELGVWLTISSVVSWISFFDIGLGNGLRNKVSIALANNNEKEARIYISTAYTTLGLISLTLFLVFLPLSLILNYNKIFNVDSNVSNQLNQIMSITLSTYLIQFVLQLINTVLLSIHNSAKASLISLFGQALTIACLIILKSVFEINLILLTCIATICPLIVLAISNIYYYNTSLKYIAPSYKLFRKTYAQNIFTIGGKFFLIQIGAIVFFQTNSLIISRLIGPLAVTEFNVAYKLFNSISMFSVIIMTTLWSSYTDAYEKKDYLWIKKSLQFTRVIWLGLSVVAIVFLIFSDNIYNVWLNNEIKIDFYLSTAMAVNVIVLIWQNIHVYFLNGIGKLNLQLYLVVVCAIFNIPLSLYLGKSYGLIGIVSANTILFSIMGTIFYFQSCYILNKEQKRF